MITIIESIMGSGKTTFMIDYINETYRDYLGLCLNDQDLLAPKFLYVAPILAEVDRINQACPGLNFRDPQPIEGRKLHHLSSLVEQGANICTTHALFRLLNRDVYEKLKAKNYILVIDEVLDCVGTFEDLTQSDRKLLFKDRLVYVEPETKKLRWNHREHGNYRGKFDHIRNLCDNGNLVLFRDTALIWEFPTDYLRCFDQVFVLTYLFNGSPMSAYLRAEDLEHELKTLKNDQLVSWAEHSDETEVKDKLRELITIYEGPANNWGVPKGRENPFSSGWFDRCNPGDLRRLKASLEHWFKSFAKTPSAHNAWTAFTKVRSVLKGARYAKGWIPNNAKATNDHIERRSLAYLCNVFYQPMIKGYFEDRGIKVQEGLHALSEMVQWIWRSQIRRGDPITVFIPSERMRSLLIDWLRGSDDSQIGESLLAA
jgi:hypothetical protein